MNTRENIIENIIQYQPSEIINFLRSGIITIPEIIEENPMDFEHSKRREIEDMLWEKIRNERNLQDIRLYLNNYPNGRYREQAEEVQEEQRSQSQEGYGWNSVPQEHDSISWEWVDKDSIESLRSYIEANPEGTYIHEAQNKLRSLERRDARRPRGAKWLLHEINNILDNSAESYASLIEEYLEKGRTDVATLIEVIDKDHNILPLESIKILIDKGKIGTHHLEEIGIDDDFIDVVDNNHFELIDTGIDTSGIINPNYINQISQEIYFWGMPSSGKTCAIGAILSVAASGTIAKTFEPNMKSEAIDYMRQLSQLFIPHRISKIPARTSAEFVAEMGFWLHDFKDRKHSLTMIDIAGELLPAMYWAGQGKLDNLTPEQRLGYDCLKNILVDNTSKNSKLHFFVLEYGAHERTERGLNQDQMLRGALSHIEELGILSKTDGVYIILTKADKAFEQGGDVSEVLANYVRTHYQSFYNLLVEKTKRLNGGHIEMYPFSIGEVCFRDLCRFDPETASDIVKLFLEKTVGEKTGKIGIFKKGMRQ